jgi:hypothetical protein
MVREFDSGEHAMKLSSPLLIFALALIVMPMNAEKRTPNQAEDIQLLRLDRRWQQAVATGDTEFLEKRTADDFRFTHWGKTTADSKADWIQWAKQVPRHFLERKVSDQSLEIHGDIALVFGRLDVRTLGDRGSNLCYAISYAHLYGRRNGQWMFLSHRTTQSLEASHPCSQSKSK